MWGIYVTVSDVDATAKKVGELGGKILFPPTDIPNVGRFCVIQDPQGAVISAITYKCRNWFSLRGANSQLARKSGRDRAFLPEIRPHPVGSKLKMMS